MNIWEINKLLLFLVCAVPGFITAKVYAMQLPEKDKNFSERVMDIVTLSIFSYVLTMPIAIFLLGVDPFNLTVGWSSFSWFIAACAVAVLIGLGWAKLRLSSFAFESIPHPIERAWDYAFSNSLQGFVIVTLKDGSKIGGRLDANSMASSYPAPEQLFLGEAWYVNDKGGFDRKLNCSMGILVISEIVSVEFVGVEKSPERESKVNVHDEK